MLMNEDKDDATLRFDDKFEGLGKATRGVNENQSKFLDGT
jgi:hypothetical protein